MLIRLLSVFPTCFIADCSSSLNWQCGPQFPATPVMEGMIFFHNYLMFFMVLIGVSVCYMLLKILNDFNHVDSSGIIRFSHSSVLEIVWTLLPAFVLLLIAVPSFTLLYSLDELVDPLLTVKIIGHQWYWTYEYSDYACDKYQGSRTVTYDSYMAPTHTLGYDFGYLRLLETDRRLVLPQRVHIRLLVTAADVIHSWAVPSFGIKIDGTPGRLTQGSLFVKAYGCYFGQCSEICGVNHAFMPISIFVAPQGLFQMWLLDKIFYDFEVKV